MKTVAIKEMVLIGVGYVLGLALYVDSANAFPHHPTNLNNQQSSNLNNNQSTAGASNSTTTGGMSVNTVQAPNQIPAMETDWHEAYDAGVTQRAKAKDQAFRERFCMQNPQQCVVVLP